MKKLMIILGSLVVFIVVALIAIPLFVNVDKYRPQILKAANEQINGHLELGELKLKLWGSIKVGVAKLTLEDAKKRKVVSVKDAEVIIPWSSIFGGKPLLTFAMVEPEVRVVKGSDGKLNVMSLMKNQAPTAAPNTAPSTGKTTTAASGKNAPVKSETTNVNNAPSESDQAQTAATKTSSGKNSEKTELPSIVTNARLGINLEKAMLYYKDEATGQESLTKDLNVLVKDFSLSRKTEMEVSGIVQASQEKTFKVSGPFSVSVSIDPETSGGQVTKADVEYKVDLDDLDIQSGTMFHKAKGMKTNMQGKLLYEGDALSIKDTAVRFFNAELKASGKITNLKSEPFDPSVKFALTSNSIDLKPWNELIPMLKEYALTGSLNLGANADGLLSKLTYNADLGVKDLKAKSTYLKTEPVTNIQVKIVTDKIEKILMTVKAPGNDLTLDGSMVSFTAPKLNLKLSSQSLDLDQLVNMPEPKHASRDWIASAIAADAAKEENFDAMLEPMRKNPMMESMTALLDIQMKLIKFYDVRITDTNGKISMKNLNASIDQFNSKIFDGSIGMKASVAMKPATPAYTFQSSVAGFDLKKATESKLEMFKNTVIGKLNMKMEGSGSSFNPTPAKKNLNARGNMKIDNAIFTSIDIAKIATEGVNKGMEAIGDKIPGIKGKRLKMDPNKQTHYDFISSDFTILGGKFTAPNFLAKSAKNESLDIKGFTQVGLIDQELVAEWELIDTYDITHAHDISVDVSGVHVDHVLAEGNNPVVIPISVNCKYTAPCPSYKKLPEHFLKVALGNAKKGATTAVKNEAKDKAKDVGKKLLKGLFK